MSDPILPPRPEFSPYEPPAAPIVKGGRSPWFYVLWGCGGLMLFFLLLVGSCVGYLASRGSELTPACESYLAKVQAGNYAGAYAETDSQFKANGWDEATFTRFEQRMQRTLGHLDSKTRVGVQVFPQERHLQYRASYSKGPVLITFILSSSEGTWKVAGVKYNSPLVEQGLTCPSCGARNRLDAAFCTRCGKPLESNP